MWLAIFDRGVDRLNSFILSLQVGLLYDEVSLQNVLDMTNDWTAEERQMLRNEVCNGVVNSMVITFPK